jgi:hypothetical protein
MGVTLPQDFARSLHRVATVSGRLGVAQVLRDHANIDNAWLAANGEWLGVARPADEWFGVARPADGAPADDDAWPGAWLAGDVEWPGVTRPADGGPQADT